MFPPQCYEPLSSLSCTTLANAIFDIYVYMIIHIGKHIMARAQHRVVTCFGVTIM